MSGPTTLPDAEREKAVAAARAVEMVTDGMKVGLGTGSTAAYAVRLLGERVRNGLRIVGVPTSERTRQLADDLGIPLTDLATTPELDLAIDGADEADPEMRLIKGGGGALLREKIVACAARRFVVIADSAKLVQRLGRFPLPVEVVKFAAALIQRDLVNLGAQPRLRLTAAGTPFVTDEGHCILDASFGTIDDPERVAAVLSRTPGVVEHGLFIGIASTLVVGCGEAADVIERA
jgi:ribose 5-phosphate isomerase A